MVDMSMVLMGIVFIGFFSTVMIYDYVSSITNSGVLSNACPQFTQQFVLLTNPIANHGVVIGGDNCDPLDPNCNVGGGFSSGGGQGGGGGSSGADGESNWYDFLLSPFQSIINFLDWIYNKISSILESLANLTTLTGNILASFFLILTTNCSAITPIQVFMYCVFLPFIIGFLYIMIRLIKSLIPMIGGD